MEGKFTKKNFWFESAKEFVREYNLVSEFELTLGQGIDEELEYSDETVIKVILEDYLTDIYGPRATAFFVKLDGDLKYEIEIIYKRKPYDKIFVTDVSDAKCSVCNWKGSVFYGIGHNVDEAKEYYEEFEDNDKYGQGICAECMTDFIKDNEFRILR